MCQIRDIHWTFVDPDVSSSIPAITIHIHYCTMPLLCHYYAITMPLLFLIPAIDPLDIWTIESRSLMIGLTTTIWGQCVIESWHRQAGAKFFTTVPEES